jgi:hypothetical protein
MGNQEIENGHGGEKDKKREGIKQHDVFFTFG